ncbi:MAG TPA: hypothetical protein VGC74_04435 [Stenotrophomonas sp.]|jgi:hypothetical protein
MNLISSTSLIVASTLLLGFAAVCTWLAPPVSGSMRDLLVLATAGGGLAFAWMAIREIRALSAEQHYMRARQSRLR